MSELVRSTASWLWGPPMLIFLFVLGAVFTFLLKGLQFSQFFKSGKLTYTQRSGSGEGNITPLQSLFGALGGLIGNGNIAGAATAIAMGGPGALLWMWIGSFFGMIIVYTETLLALMYREKGSDGIYDGGPMYYIQKTLKLKWLALLFAFAMGAKALLATATIQSNSISLAAVTVLGSSWVPEGIPVQLPYCFLVAVLTLVVSSGGIKTIAGTLEKITPIMVIFFLVLGSGIIFANINVLFEVLRDIFDSAFNGRSATGGFAGAGVMMAIRFGVARGFYSNEAGTGSAPIMYSTAKTDNIYYQSLISMFGVFIDTVVATFTIMTILMTGVWTTGLTSTALTTSAFQALYGSTGGYLIFGASLLFGYSTLIAWCFYGEQCFVYIWGPKMRVFYRWAFAVSIIFGFFEAESLWSWGDLLNAITIIINLVALIFLVKRVMDKTKEFRSQPKEVSY